MGVRGGESREHRRQGIKGGGFCTTLVWVVSVLKNASLSSLLFSSKAFMGHISTAFSLNSYCILALGVYRAPAAISGCKGKMFTVAHD